MTRRWGLGERRRLSRSDRLERPAPCGQGANHKSCGGPSHTESVQRAPLAGHSVPGLDPLIGHAAPAIPAALQ
jgi:hypothetical protein